MCLCVSVRMCVFPSPHPPPLTGSGGSTIGRIGRRNQGGVGEGGTKRVGGGCCPGESSKRRGALRSNKLNTHRGRTLGQFVSVGCRLQNSVSSISFSPASNHSLRTYSTSHSSQPRASTRDVRSPSCSLHGRSLPSLEGPTSTAILKACESPFRAIDYRSRSPSTGRVIAPSSEDPFSGMMGGWVGSVGGFTGQPMFVLVVQKYSNHIYR